MNIGNATMICLESLLSSLIAETIISIIKNKKNSIIEKIFVYFFIYFLVIIFNVSLYALIRSFDLGAPFQLMFTKLFNYMLEKYLWAMIITPIIVEFIVVFLSKEIQSSRNKVIILTIKWIIIVCGFSFFVIKPFLINYEIDTDNDKENLEFIYCAKFYDEFNFIKYASEGYLDKEETTKPVSVTNGDVDDINDLIDKDIDLLNFEELIRVAEYYRNFGIYNYSYASTAKEYMEKAYRLYLENQDMYPKDLIARLFWLKGDYEEDGDFYVKADEVYETINAYINAAGCYYNAYINYNYCEPEKALNNYFKAIQEDNDENVIKFAIYLLLNSFSKDNESGLNYVEEFSGLLPDDLRIRMIIIYNHIVNNCFDKNDLKYIQNYLEKEQFKDCPKLLLAEAYYSKLYWYGVGMRLDDIYTLFTEKRDYFDPEDVVNLSWLLLDNNDVKKAREVIESIDCEDCYEAAMVNAAITLQENSNDLNKRELQLFYSEIEAYRKDFSKHYGSDWTLKYETNRAYIYSILDIYETGTDEISIALNSGKYDECIQMCNSILEIDANNEKIRSIKADALIKKAETLEDETSRQQLYLMAESTLSSIKNKYENDYLNTLKKLDNLYKKMPEKDVELRKVNDILEAIN